MGEIQFFGAVLVILGVLILIGYAIYLFIQSTDMPIVIRIGLTALMIGILVIFMSLVRDRLLEIQREKRNKIRR